MGIQLVEKRDGRKVAFDRIKIFNAIKKAFENTENQPFDKKVIDDLTDQVENFLGREGQPIVTVEHIQDVVERILMKNNYYQVCKNYILYRQKRTQIRERKNEVRKAIARIIRKTDRENANVGNGPAAKLLQIAEAEGRDFMEKELTSPDVLEAMRENIIYPHDYSWGPIGTTTCTFIPLGKLLQNGFNTGHGYIRTPKRIKTAAQLACIIFQSNQNDQHGGQAFGWFDRDMAPFVKREYEWQLNNLKENFAAVGIEPDSVDPKLLEEKAWENTVNETAQAMEALVFNLNTMHSRAGAQVCFTSINFGTDTSREGRLISEMLLKAYDRGLGKGEQPIFPNLIFKVKDGVNAKEGDPNFDLFKLAMEVSSRRLFPNYVFQDSSFNKDFPGDVPTMGCRTRISWNVNKPEDEQTCEGRGNLSFTTINIVGIALRATYKEKWNEDFGRKFEELKTKYDLKIPEPFKDKQNIKIFFVLHDKYIDLAVKQLLDRYRYQCSFTKADFPFLMNGIWMDSEKLKENDTLESVLKHGTLSVGFIGLAETLKCLVGKHHGESEEADMLGEEIVRFMRAKTDEATQKYHLNFSLLATPAEGLAGKFLVKDRAVYGVIEGVTDKEWYTNSFHVPVEYKISVFKKIKVEGKYHKYCNAGHISYIELESPPQNNTEAIYTILKYMKENDMGYVAINYPVDRCRECNFQGVIDEKCPACHSKNISRIRRITGYLAELKQFNHAKKMETLSRSKHYFPH